MADASNSTRSVSLTSCSRTIVKEDHSHQWAKYKQSLLSSFLNDDDVSTTPLIKLADSDPSSRKKAIWCPRLDPLPIPKDTNDMDMIHVSDMIWKNNIRTPLDEAQLRYHQPHGRDQRHRENGKDIKSGSTLTSREAEAEEVVDEGINEYEDEVEEIRRNRLLLVTYMAGTIGCNTEQMEYIMTLCNHPLLPYLHWRLFDNYRIINKDSAFHNNDSVIISVVNYDDVKMPNGNDEHKYRRFVWSLPNAVDGSGSIWPYPINTTPSLPSSSSRTIVKVTIEEALLYSGQLLWIQSLSYGADLSDNVYNDEYILDDYDPAGTRSITMRSIIHGCDIRLSLPPLSSPKEPEQMTRDQRLNECFLFLRWEDDNNHDRTKLLLTHFSKEYGFVTYRMADISDAAATTAAIATTVVRDETKDNVIVATVRGVGIPKSVQPVRVLPLLSSSESDSLTSFGSKMIWIGDHYLLHYNELRNHITLLELSSNGRRISCEIIVKWTTADKFIPSYKTNRRGSRPFDLNDRFIIVTHCHHEGNLEKNNAHLYCISSILHAIGDGLTTPITIPPTG
jgi:hypothetical protein